MMTKINPPGHFVTRRTLLVGAMLGAGFASGCARAASVDDPAMAGPLGDLWIGSPEATVTFIEYAAVTCPHCASFHNEVWPGIKTRWIDTGRMRFALRGLPLSPLDTAAFMLARTDDGQHYYPVTDLLFERQRSWAFVDQPLDAMRDLLRQAGFDRAKFDAALANQAFYEQVNSVQAQAMNALGVHGTRTLFLNGARIGGAPPAEAFDEIVRKLVG